MLMLSKKMDRKKIVIAKKEVLDAGDAKYWKGSAIEEKLQTMTYLRECFYGEEATTGRIPGICTMLKLK